MEAAVVAEENLTLADVFPPITDDATSGLNDRQLALRLLWMSCGYPVLAVGTVGHVLLLALACLGSEPLRDWPLRVFAALRSASGLLALYLDLLTWIVFYQSFAETHFMSMTTELGCRLHAAALEFLLQFYAWMEACVALERALTARWPHLLPRCLSRRNCAILVAAIAAVLLGVSVIPLLSSGYVEAWCAVVDARLYYRAWLHVRGLLLFVLPSALVLAGGAATLYTLLRPPPQLADGVKKASLVTAAALSLNAIFVVTTLPLAVAEWISPVLPESDAEETVACATNLIMYLGSSLTFVACVTAAVKSRQLSGSAPLQLETRA